MNRRVIGWLLVPVDAGLYILGIALLALPRVQPFHYTSPFVVLATFVFATVGAAIVWRRPEHPIGWIYCASGLLLSTNSVTGSYLGHLLVDPTAPFGLVVQIANGVTFFDGFLLPLTFGLLLFPDGHLLSPRWRPFGVFVAFVLVLFVVGPVVANVAGGGGDVPPVVLVAAFSAIFGTGVSVIVRWRRASGPERAQLKWVGASGTLFVALVIGEVAVSLLAPDTGTVLGSSLGDLVWFVLSLSFMLIPLSIGIAILRYRLYDIDVLINRSLVYGVLSAVLAATYFAVVLAFETILRPITAGSEVSVALSTLVVVALFSPLRQRIQRLVDRRFYRSRYDAARTLDAFSVRLRDEVDLEAVRVSLLGAVDQTVHPAQADLWLRVRAS